MTIDERKSISTGVIQNLILENRGKLSIDTSEVIVEGDISSLTYSDKESEKAKASSFMSKIFK